MINEEKDDIQIYVINSNTGHVVRSECILTNESLITVAQGYATKDSIVVTSISEGFYCFYIKREPYFFGIKNNIELINFFNDVIGGLYDNARDSFHIQYGRVITLYQLITTENSSKYETILNCIYNIWEARYYSRCLRRGKND